MAGEIDTDIYAPIYAAQEYKAKRNALLAQQQEQSRNQLMQRIIAENVNPATGQIDYGRAMQTAPMLLRPDIQAAQQKFDAGQVELEGKRATTRLNISNADATWMKTNTDLLARVGDQAGYDAWRSNAIAEKPFLASMLPEQYTPETKRQLLLTAESAMPKLEFLNTGTAFRPTNPYGGQQVGKAIPIAVSPDVAAREASSEPGNKPPSGYRWTEDGGLEAIPGGPGDKPINVRNERKEFDALPEVKRFKSAWPILVSARKAPDTSAGDIELAYAVGKLFDPESVVREGELKLVFKAGSILEQLIGGTSALLSGGARFPKEMRQRLLDTLSNRALVYRQAYDQVRDTYSGYARDLGTSPENIVGKHPAAAYSQPAAPASKAPAGVDQQDWDHMTPEERKLFQPQGAK